MLGELSSSTSPAGERGEGSKQPRKILQPETPQNKEQSVSDPKYDSGSTHSSGIPAQSESPEPVFPDRLQEGGAVQDFEEPESSDEDREDGVYESPESIHSSLEPDSDSEIPDSETEQNATHVTTTIAQVEERKVTTVQAEGQPTAATEGTGQPRRVVSILSQTSGGQQQYVVQSTVQGGVQKKASFYRETRFPTVTEVGHSAPIPTSASMAVGPWMPPKSTFGSTKKRLLSIQHLHQKENKRVISLLSGEHEDYERLCKEQFETFREEKEWLTEEKERLMLELASSASRVKRLEIELSSLPEGHLQIGAPQYAKIDSAITTITTNITTITTTITTVTTRVEKWKKAGSAKGQIIISNADLQQLALDLSTISSRMIELQEHYDELSRGFGSVRHELQVTLSIRDEQGRTIASLTAEVTQWKNADATKAQQLTALREDNESLRHDLSVSSTRLSDLQQRYDAQSGELVSARNEVQTQALSIDEKDRMIASLKAEVTRWKQSDANKAEQLVIARQDYDKVQRELSASSSRMDDLQKRYDAQSEEFCTVQNELQITQSLAKERDYKITTLVAEVDHLERAGAAMQERFDAERRAKEKLQEEFVAFSSQTADLKKRFEAQSEDMVSTRKELQEKVSLLEKKEHAITSLKTEVAHAESEIIVKTEQITTARTEVERLRGELSDSSSRVAGLQKRIEGQSQEIDSLRGELLRIEALYPGTGGASENAVSRRIASALAEKDQQMQELRGDLDTATSRNAELQRSYEALTTEVSTTRDELKVKTSQYERTITTLNAQVDQWKRAHDAKADPLAATLTQIKKLQQDFSTSTSQLAELQSRYEAQSRDITELRIKLQASATSHEAKDRTIASLTAQVERLERSDADKSEKIVTALQQVDKLNANLSASTSQITELGGRLEAQSRDFIRVREELRAQISLHEDKDHTIVTISAERDQWERKDVAKAEQIATMIGQIEKLRQDSSASASQLAELEGHYKMRSQELISVRHELQITISSNEEKGRTVAALTAQVEEWKRTDALKEKRLEAAGKRVEDLQRELTNSTTQLAELQQRYEARLKELDALHTQIAGEELESGSIISSLRSQIETLESSVSIKTKEVTTARENLDQLRRDLANASSQIESWKGSDAAKAAELTAARKDLDQFRRDLAAASSQISVFQQQSAESTFQIERLKSSDATKSEELTTARKDLDQLCCDLAAASSQISVFQQQSTVSTSQIERLKSSIASKTEELTTACKDLDQLRCDLAAASSQISVFQQQSTEFTSQIERLKSSVATKTEELTTAREDLNKLRRDLSSSSTQIIECQQRCKAQSVEFTSRIEEWERLDAAKADELTVTRKKLDQLQDELSTSSSRLIKLQQLYDVQSTELSSLREQLTAMSSAGGDKDQRVAALNAQIEKWRRADGEKAKELSTLSTLNTELQAQLDALAKSSSVVSKESREFYERITAEMKDYATVTKFTAKIDEWFREDNDRAEKLARELERRNKEKEELRHKVDTLKEIYIRSPELKQIFQSETIEIRRQYEEQLAAVRVQVAERQSQLDGVKRFVTTADTYADNAISQELQKLNAEVQQSTTFMFECIVEDFRARTTEPTDEQASAAQRVSEAIGQTLTDCLWSKESDVVALYLPIAFQAYLTYYLRDLISSWTAERGYNDLINKTYERLQNSEAQTVSGRWRSLTRAYISPNSTSDSKKLVSDAVAGLSDIVVAASCATSLSDAKTKMSKFERKLSSIFILAGKLSKMIGEVVSSDFEVLVIRPTEMFEETTMEDDMEDDDRGPGMPGGTADGQTVLCSTQLGMTKKMQLESGKKDTLMVTKAKVILESFLEG